MAKPFISYTWEREEQMLWLKELLLSLGFEQPIVVHGGSPLRPAEFVREEVSNADCLFALISPDPKDEKRQQLPASWVEVELSMAIGFKLPIGAICEPEVTLPDVMKQSFTYQSVNFADSKALLKNVPEIVKMLIQVKRIVDQDPNEMEYPFIYDEIVVVNKVSASRWDQFRSVRITAQHWLPSTEHSIELSDRTDGVSLRLADVENDLVVKSDDKPGLRTQITRNDDHCVAYRIEFEPPLQSGETRC